MTGTNVIPSMGYSKLKELRLELNPSEFRDIAIHTCFNQFVIKKSYFESSKTHNLINSRLFNLFKHDNLVKLASETSMA